MVLLRVDFSNKIGLGHLKRQEAFINEKWKMVSPKNQMILEGVEENEKCLIICKECDKKLTKLPVIKIKNEKDFFEKVKELNPKEVIVDNYNFTLEDEKKFKKLFPNIKLIVFDDTYERHFADLIINHNLGAKKEKYCEPKKVKIIKPLIREEFKKAKRKKLKKEGIFISLGGSDSKGLTLKLLKILKPLKPKINLYITSANKDLEKIKKFAFLNKWVHLHINEDVAIGMAKSEFAIITPSVISYEAIFMNLDFIAIKTADNQKEVAKYLKKKYKVIDEKEIKKIPKFINRRKKRSS